MLRVRVRVRRYLKLYWCVLFHPEAAVDGASRCAELIASGALVINAIRRGVVVRLVQRSGARMYCY